MNCSDARRWIQLYMDGRLEGRDQPNLARHLSTCDACRGELAAFQLLVDGLSCEDPLRSPDLLTRSIMRRIRQADAATMGQSVSHPFALGWADAVLAASLATVVTIIFLWFEPALRAAVSAMAKLALDSVTHGITAATSSWSPVAVWLVWIGAGVALTLWFAGREVRAEWRRTLLTRLPH